MIQPDDLQTQFQKQMWLEQQQFVPPPSWEEFQRAQQQNMQRGLDASWRQDLFAQLYGGPYNNPLPPPPIFYDSHLKVKQGKDNITVTDPTKSRQQRDWTWLKNTAKVAAVVAYCVLTYVYARSV
jgi:hypothetical protein